MILVPVLTVTKSDAENSRSVLIEGFDNELTLNQSSLETDTTGWVASTDTTIARSTAQAAAGVASLLVTRINSIGSGVANTPTGTSGIPVAAGQQYTATAVFRAVATSRTCNVLLQWWTSAGVFISQFVSPGVASNTTGWVQDFITATAPATAAFASVAIVGNSMAVNEAMYVDGIQLKPGTSFVWNEGGYVTSSRRYNLQRSVDAGGSWTDVLQADKVIPAGQRLTVIDHEAPAYTAVVYRVRALVIGGVTGSWSANTGETVTSPTTWWLKCPDEPVLNMPIKPDGVQLALAKPLGVAYALDDDAAVVTHHGTKGFTIKATIRTLSQTEYRMLLSLLADGRTLLLQAIHGEQWYVQPSDGITFSMVRAQPTSEEPWAVRHAHEVDVSFVEVSRPGRYRLLYG